MKKGGQVTIFVIVGILLVVSVAFLFYFRSELQKTTFQEQLEKSQIIPAEIKPVKEFIDSCVAQTSTDALDILSSQGGYIALQTPSLEIFQNGQRIPYWFYEAPNGVQQDFIPSIPFMQSELSLYITENIGLCLSNVSLYEDVGYTITFESQPQTSVMLNRRNVEVTLQYPITISKAGITKKIEKHYANIESNFYDIYQTAKALQEEENKNHNLEEYTLDMLAVYDEIPFSHIDFSCSPKLFSKLQVEKDLKKILSKNILALKLENSGYTLTADENKYFIVPSPNNKFIATFLFSEDWPFFITIEPSEGDVLKPDSVIKPSGVTRILSSFVCINNYHFVYDIRYPILITLTDGSLEFNFVTHVIIKNNQPRKNVQSIEGIPEDINLCEISHSPLEVETFERFTNSELPDVSVSYQCITTTCDIGKTVQTRFGAIVKGKIPPCVNGILKAEKESYYLAQLIINSNEEQGTINLFLEKIKTLNLVVKVLDKDTKIIRDLSPDESVTLTFEHTTNDFVSSVSYPQQKTLDFITGEYRVHTELLTNKKMRIQGSTVESCTTVPRSGILGFFLTEKKCVTTTLEPFETENTIIGGAEFNFTVEISDVHKNTLTLYTIHDKIPETAEEALLIADKIQYNAGDKNFKKPVFS